MERLGLHRIEASKFKTPNFPKKISSTPTASTRGRNEKALYRDAQRVVNRDRNVFAASMVTTATRTPW